MEKFVQLSDSPIYKNKYILSINADCGHFVSKMKGSYNVIIARLLNLSYADYLRYVRDRLGAELVGRNCLYVVPCFDDTPEVNEFVKLLNNRVKLINDYIKHPYDIVRDVDGTMHTEDIK